jgi:hypothetical protein
MVSKVETGFGKSIIELKQNLGLLYPEQVRPEGAGVVCLENSDKPRFYTYPGRMSGQQGETYWVEGGTVPSGKTLLREVIVVDEIGNKLNIEQFEVESQENTRGETLDALHTYEELVLQGIFSAMKKLQDYAHEAGVEYRDDATFVFK